MRIMALDIGEERIGVALSDPFGLIANPLVVLPRAKSLQKQIKAILDLADSKEAEEIVVGMPKMLDGSAGIQARKAEEIIAALRVQTDIPVVSWDERLSTVQAERVLLEADVGRSNRRRVVDKMAAAVILQNYLDWKATRR